MIIPSKPIEYIFPKSIASDHSGYEFLAMISIGSYNFKSGEIHFNFTNNEYFQENLCSPLGAIMAGLKKRKNRIIFDGVMLPNQNMFEKNGFYKLVDYRCKTTKDVISNIDFKKFTTQDNLKFQAYINEQLLAKKEFPHVSNLLKKQINVSILEIFNNAHTHGGCEFLYTCGHYSTENMTLNFTISDMGTTIRKNVNNYFKSGNDISGHAAISWAVQRGNTTKNDNIPGGLGLSLIREFLALNEGTIQIISSNGYWEEKKGIIFANSFKNRFLGTIVNFEFNLNDKNTYMLSSELEIDPKNVF